MRSIRSYLPRREQTEKTEMMHVRISPDVKLELKKIAARNQWKPSDIIRGAILKFIDDESRKSA